MTIEDFALEGEFQTPPPLRNFFAILNVSNLNPGCMSIRLDCDVGLVCKDLAVVSRVCAERDDREAELEDGGHQQRLPKS